MKKMRKMAAALLCVAMVAGMVTGCGGETAPKEKANLNVVAAISPFTIGFLRQKTRELSFKR